jgi:hypothetical protein
MKPPSEIHTETDIACSFWSNPYDIPGLLVHIISKTNSGSTQVNKHDNISFVGR